MIWAVNSWNVVSLPCSLLLNLGLETGIDNTNPTHINLLCFLKSHLSNQFPYCVLKYMTDVKCDQMLVISFPQDSPLFQLLRQAQEEGPAEQVEPPATFNQPLQHNHTAADLWVHHSTPLYMYTCHTCTYMHATKPVRHWVSAGLSFSNGCGLSDY